MRYAGDSIGELDEDGIAEFYPNCKVRKEGDIYLATPHTTNKTRRRKHREEVITVSEQDGKLQLETPPVKTDIDDDDTPVESVQMSFEEVIAAQEKSPSKSIDEPEKRTVTRKQLFDELYMKYDNLKPYLRKQAILKDMLPLFKTEEAAKVFVDDNWRRRRRNNYFSQ